MMRNEEPPVSQILSDSSLHHEPDGLRSKAKAKAKRLFTIDDSDFTSEDHEEDKYFDAVVEEVNQSPAFDAGKILNTSRLGNGSRTERTKNILQGTADAIAHPIASIKSKATRKTAGKLAKSRPYLSNQANFDFLEAHDDLQQAKDAQHAGDDEDANEDNINNIDYFEKRVDKIQRNREEMRVAWVTDRHVHRIRAVEKIPPPFPPVQHFERKDDHGFTEFKWGEWIGYKLLHGSRPFTAQYIDDFEELPFDIDTFRRHIERLIIVSAPLQEFAVDVRKIYRWEDQWRTSKWLITYLLLWYTSYIMSFVYAYIVYATAKNYYCPSSVSALRDEFSRNINRGATALKAGELMDQHGNKDWLGPLLDKLGPYLQLQIADLANLLEVYDSFIHFRSPQNTFHSLFLFAAMFLLSACASIQFTMKVFWFVVGLIFFGCWPISSLYPRYRLLVSPLKWAFWDIPTYPEWSLQYLQERGSSTLRKINLDASKDSTSRFESPQVMAELVDDNLHSPKAEKIHLQGLGLDNVHEECKDILSFRCILHHVPGHLILSTKTIRFEALFSNILPCKPFNKPYSELIEMSKRQTEELLLAPLAKMTIGKDKLELKFRGEAGGDMHSARQNGHVVVLLENVRGRDKAFNSIAGFSGVRWQCLQKASGKLAGMENGTSNASP
ncbi:hypothetical protein BCIN_03g08810 [Botrytis cinerea B05.10]|uniref:Uncharacterized protein n=3 Tax=Botryotinia fuckeliana TaxID=40559 RepID=A0A384JDN3_BOTFB|nr:hypothetical protein BCIN_03g08810 [Botrytis cinerea B05.10]ATZ48696.1 hypothetical protein BCIN_03g08810 [Botrytis cinerea B05.10]EMR81228.1 hypothetical protein BcDW1_10056 [Botrytis cinerea BcDW1]CCD52524.1 hypothetical protein BofuT4_P078170.1 [Botrytis cinerea T4]